MAQRPKYSAYLPDKCKLEKLPRSLLFTLIYNIEPNYYNFLKEKAKARQESNKYKKLAEFSIEVSKDTMTEINLLPDKTVKIFLNLF